MTTMKRDWRGKMMHLNPKSTYLSRWLRSCPGRCLGSRNLTIIPDQSFLRPHRSLFLIQSNIQTPLNFARSCLRVKHTCPSYPKLDWATRELREKDPYGYQQKWSKSQPLNTQRIQTRRNVVLNDPGKLFRSMTWYAQSRHSSESALIDTTKCHASRLRSKCRTHLRMIISANTYEITSSK